MEGSGQGTDSTGFLGFSVTQSLSFLISPSLLSPFFISVSQFALSLLTPLSLLFNFPLLFSPFCTLIHPGDKSYKIEIISAGSSSMVGGEKDGSTAQSPVTPSKAEEANEVIGALLSSDSAEEAFEDSDSENEMKDKSKARDAYFKKLAFVKQDVQKFKENFLLGAIWNGRADNQKIKAKLKADWKFLRGDFEVVDHSYGWLEFQFSGPMERALIWENQPYHVFGLLLALIPWQLSFDPSLVRIERLDLWIRIPFLPTEYMSVEMIKAIIKYNKIGKFIKLDPFSEKRIRAKYARVCVNVKNGNTLKGYVEVPDCFQELRDYHVWYEVISDGCGNCGEDDHIFESCPLRMVVPKKPKIVVEKSPKKTAAPSSRPSKTDEDNSDEEVEEDWKKVVDKKGKNR